MDICEFNQFIMQQAGVVREVSDHPVRRHPSQARHISP
jgi:hypothetical protein